MNAPGAVFKRSAPMTRRSPYRTSTITVVPAPEGVELEENQPDGWIVTVHPSPRWWNDPEQLYFDGEPCNAVEVLPHALGLRWRVTLRDEWGYRRSVMRNLSRAQADYVALVLTEPPPRPGNSSRRSRAPAYCVYRH